MSATVFENAVVHQRPGVLAPVEALAVRDGRIVRAGTVAECRDAVPDGGRVDLQGRTVIPGLIDSHVHALQMATQSLELDLSGCRSFSEILHAVEAELNSLAPRGATSAGWLLAGGWGGWGGDGSWAGGGPDLAALDRVTGAVPVALHAADLHTYWLNTAALERLGMVEHTRGAHPTGVISEADAFAAQSRIESDTRHELETRMDAVLLQFLQHGVTGIHDIDGTTALQYFRTAEAASRLPLRVHKLTAASEMETLIADGIRSGDGSSWLRYGGVKIFADGSLSSHTCHLGEAFPGEPGNVGIATTERGELTRLIAHCEANGLSVAVHAIGDQAVHDAVAALATGRRLDTVPHRIEHLQHARAADIVRFAKLGAVACMQPSSCTTDYPVVDRLLGDRDLISYGWRSLLDAGATVAFSSDAPVESINPFLGMHAAITRQRLGGAPDGGWQPEQRITLAEAFAGYTTAAAAASGESDTRGSLEVGRYADFAVLDRDPFLVDAAGLAGTRVETTVVDGSIVWTAGSAPQPPRVMESAR
ncbi:amidohydrolase [Microbacterium sp. NPDC089318]